MPRPMTRAEMIESFWPHSHRFMTVEELEKMKSKGIVYHQAIVQLSEEEKKEIDEMEERSPQRGDFALPEGQGEQEEQEAKVQTEQKESPATSE